mgnify:CR=1 FL=1
MIQKFFFTTVAVSMIFILSGGLATVSAAGVRIDSSLYPDGAATVKGGTVEADNDINVVEDTRTILTAKIVSTILGIAGVVAIFFIINNAWYMVASAGKEETLTQHKKGLMWAVIGLVLIILSYSIVRFIASIPFQAGQVPTAPTSGPSEPPASTSSGPSTGP